MGLLHRVEERISADLDKHGLTKDKANAEATIAFMAKHLSQSASNENYEQIKEKF